MKTIKARVLYNEPHKSLKLQRETIFGWFTFEKMSINCFCTLTFSGEVWETDSLGIITKRTDEFIEYRDKLQGDKRLMTEKLKKYITDYFTKKYATYEQLVELEVQV